jgi:hypothetical protein
VLPALTLDLTKDIQSLSEFKRNSQQFLQRLRLSGSPLVLTINGKAALVLQDIESYQKLRDQAATYAEIPSTNVGRRAPLGGTDEEHGS